MSKTFWYIMTYVNFAIGGINFGILLTQPSWLWSLTTTIWMCNGVFSLVQYLKDDNGPDAW